MTGRPLLKMSEEDFINWRGGTFYSLDKRLKIVFEWVHRWDAFLFVDEAESFIVNARRTDMTKGKHAAPSLQLSRLIKTAQRSFVKLKAREAWFSLRPTYRDRSTQQFLAASTFAGATIVHPKMV